MNINSDNIGNNAGNNTSMNTGTSTANTSNNNNTSTSDSRETYGNPNVLNYPTVNGITIVGVNKNGQGDVQEFKLANGQILTYADVINAAQSNTTTGLIVQEGNTGNVILRSAPDAHKENNLDNLPSFKQ
jgi:hypothetical protein